MLPRRQHQGRNHKKGKEKTGNAAKVEGMTDLVFFCGKGGYMVYAQSRNNTAKIPMKDNSTGG
jgi:hypothetical protein